MAMAYGAGQRDVRAHHDCTDIRRSFVAIDYFVEPSELGKIELLRRYVVKRDEVDIAPDPVVVSVQLPIRRIVLQPPRANGRILKPIGELNQPGLARRRRDGFVISNRQKDREIAEWRHLVGDE